MLVRLDAHKRATAMMSLPREAEDAPAFSGGRQVADPLLNLNDRPQLNAAGQFSEIIERRPHRLRLQRGPGRPTRR